MSFLVVNNNGLKNTSYISSFNNALLWIKISKSSYGNITSCKDVLHVSLTFSVLDMVAFSYNFCVIFFPIGRYQDWSR